MMRKTKRIMASLFGFLFCFGCVALTSCGDNQTSEPNQSESNSPIEDNYLYFEQYNYELSIGESKTLELFKVNVEGEANWHSSNEAVATVANGVVTAVSAGESTIKATIGEYEATCKIIVAEEQKEQNISFAFTEKHLTEGETCELAFVLENVALEEIEFSSSNADVIYYEVNENFVYVEALAAGVASVTAQVGEKTVSVEFYITALECEQLASPTNLKVRDGIVSWAPVENASGYAISFDGVNWTEISTNAYSLENKKWTVFYVKALGDEIRFLASNIEYITDGLIWNEKDINDVVPIHNVGAIKMVEDAERGSVLSVSNGLNCYPKLKIKTQTRLENVTAISYWIKVVKSDLGDGTGTANDGLAFVPNVPGSESGRSDGFGPIENYLEGKTNLTTQDGWVQITVTGLNGLNTDGISYNEQEDAYYLELWWIGRDSSRVTGVYEVLLDDIRVYEPTYHIYYDLGICDCSNIPSSRLSQQVWVGEEVELLKPSCETHKFVKWVIQGTQTEYVAGVYQYQEDLHLVAVWVEPNEEENDWSNWI